ncbi:MAG: heme lyase CcmF/NrfE family subunit [Acidimicrobiales bacterium]|nr:heme lyase CcmF/NrfE family subunit [Acidimicrobiales bacterium]
MNSVLGTSGVVLGVTASLLGVVTLAVGLRRGRADLLRTGWSYSLLVLLGAIVSVVAMQRALITRDFSVAFVHDHGSSRTPPLFNVATMWSALEGSILLWALILAGFTVHIARKFRQRLSDPLVGWALLTMLVVCAFFFLLMLGPANPFTSVTVPAGYDGPGPNPLLQEHILMAVHPPMLYLGYVGFTVPFAFAVAALATGRLGEGWLIETRRATLMAWGFLTIGIILGAWWSYEVLGWGGYWGWDPVENASLLPWITGTAYLHSVMVQERRGMLRVWNLSLLCATFSLTILGTFLTRSGVLESVHAFSDSDIGAWLLTFFGLTVAVTLGLIGWRGDRLRSPGRIDSPLSREGAFLANNVLFAGFAFVVLLGTVFPLLAEVVQDRPVTVGPPYFDRMTIPIGIALLFLMAVAPVLPWRKASSELLSQRLVWPAWGGALTLFAVVTIGARGLAPILAFGLAGFAGGAALRQVALATRRQGWRGLVGRTNGGMIVHLGVVIVAVAIAASGSYVTESEARYAPGETRVVGGHEITYLGTREVQERNRLATKVSVRVDGGKVYEPSLSQYPGFGSLIGTPSVKTGLQEDVFLSISRLPQQEGGEVTLRVIIEPLALWLWIGGGVMAFGTVLAAWPGKRRRPTDPTSAPVAEEDPEPPAAEPRRPEPVGVR